MTSTRRIEKALAELFGVPNHPVASIGWRHGEKLYETLATANELGQSEDMGEYYRIRMDDRDLNYQAYFTQGNEETRRHEDYHSHNTERLDAAKVKALLLTLPEVQAELDAWAATR